MRRPATKPQSVVTLKPSTSGWLAAITLGHDLKARHGVSCPLTGLLVEPAYAWRKPQQSDIQRVESFALRFRGVILCLSGEGGFVSRFGRNSTVVEDLVDAFEEGRE